MSKKNEAQVFEIDLGIVIYCAGYGDCTSGFFNVLDANVTLLSNILQKADFEKLIYISSTRVYMNQSKTFESSDLTICADDNRRLFNLTKLVAEELCLKSNRNAYIIRPSNVYGTALNSPLFLPSITKNAILNGQIDMYVPPDYEKDYISVEDVVSCCYKIAQEMDLKDKVINIAAGYNVTAREISNALSQETNCKVIWHDLNFPRENFEEICISTLKNIVPDYEPKYILKDLSSMVVDFKNSLNICR
ncbi:NAD-dependent epimerase/dehydratase family protein [Vibrio campbellii]|uniref:NAD-dependent epimerase/dehydratase family protein n=1 Tax=Vibrio campbellii TaxID=680 RepID=UPI001F07B8D8|nr:NAD-dependent epimerase/dehydratase family protein [Vibrio campbellii]UMM02858.1 NAD-dependent epimerase/dehydratase family protein [Vibrio campbellii]